MVRSGRLDVVAEGPPERSLGLLRRGEAFGELALLADDVRSASVRARSDSELLELDRRHFDALIREAPSFAVALTRAIGSRLAASQAPLNGSPPPRIIAVVALDPAACARETADGLAAALRRHGSVACLLNGEGRPPDAMRAALDRAESGADRVVLAAPASRSHAPAGMRTARTWPARRSSCSAGSPARTGT